MPITWKNVNAPGFVAPAGLARSGGDAVVGAFDQFANAANAADQNRITAFDNLTKEKTDLASGRISALSDLEDFPAQKQTILDSLQGDPNIDFGQLNETARVHRNDLGNQATNALSRAANQFTVDHQQEIFDQNKLKIEQDLALGKITKQDAQLKLADLPRQLEQQYEANKANIDYKKAITEEAEFRVGQQEKEGDFLTAFENTIANLTTTNKDGSANVAKADVASVMRDLGFSNERISLGWKNRDGATGNTEIKEGQQLALEQKKEDVAYDAISITDQIGTYNSNVTDVLESDEDVQEEAMLLHKKFAGDVTAPNQRAISKLLHHAYSFDGANDISLNEIKKVETLLLQAQNSGKVSDSDIAQLYENFKTDESKAEELKVPEVKNDAPEQDALLNTELGNIGSTTDNTTQPETSLIGAPILERLGKENIVNSVTKELSDIDSAVQSFVSDGQNRLKELTNQQDSPTAPDINFTDPTVQPTKQSKTVEEAQERLGFTIQEPTEYTQSNVLEATGDLFKQTNTPAKRERLNLQDGETKKWVNQQFLRVGAHFSNLGIQSRLRKSKEADVRKAEISELVKEIRTRQFTSGEAYAVAHKISTMKDASDEQKQFAKDYITVYRSKYK